MRPFSLLRDLVRRGRQALRPADPQVSASLAARWAELPETVKTPAQMLGRRFAGCEGTHGVFPRCNLACTPCYHSRDANHVRIDAGHTLAQIASQMAYLRARRGPGQHAQLIGGEVTLLGPAAHASALELMEGYSRKPMSMSHGDFDYDYLVALAVDPATGRRRFGHLSFAVHIDSTMVGRRGVRRPQSEAELDPTRRQVAGMFRRLREEHGVRSYLAHNMTVTPRNVAEVAGVVRACRDAGFRMVSFQPAAEVGDTRRWATDRQVVTDDGVWSAVEEGIGARLPYDALQVGDPRCNRTCWGFMVGDRYVPLLDLNRSAERRARDVFLRCFPGVDFGAPRPLLALRLVRIILRHPAVVPVAVAWGASFVRRAGARALIRQGARPLTFVMHSFMDAAVVRPAWELLQRGESSTDPAIQAAQQRLAACSYVMAHPESDQLVPACAQHAVFDPQENLDLKRLLPLVERSER